MAGTGKGKVVEREKNTAKFSFTYQERCFQTHVFHSKKEKT
jgi:hypothetical protein